ncbi:uncharacterized protein LOC114285395 [Camellia sinensis]|uniref:uncharacterized protein LOC114285395 n=1 Tax=Camellia sinensis TaxID=4442 RepID=UPI001036617D|nr:uncharacterized protein LOC114285395 [Camellia sinensis]
MAVDMETMKRQMKGKWMATEEKRKSNTPSRHSEDRDRQVTPSQVENKSLKISDIQSRTARTRYSKSERSRTESSYMLGSTYRPHTHQTTSRCQPFFQALMAKFEWDKECDRALESLKEYMSSPPLLVTPVPGEELLLYLVVSQHAVSTVLVRAEGIQHLPILYVSKTLLDAKTRYLPLEKLALVLMMALRKLSHYFHAHTVIVLTAFPLKALFKRADFSGRILKWEVELGQFDIKFQPRTTIKAQTLTDFVAEFTPGSHLVCPVDLTDANELGGKVLRKLRNPRYRILSHIVSHTGLRIRRKERTMLFPVRTHQKAKT